jgi:hypothetical protein
MPRRRAFLLGAVATFGRLSRASTETLSDDAIHAILKERVDVDQHGTGIVSGMLDASGRRLDQIQTHGVPPAPIQRPRAGLIPSFEQTIEMRYDRFAWSRA